MSDLFQWAIIAFIVLSVLRHVWRSGAANPEGTGALGRKVSALSAQVTVLSADTAVEMGALSKRASQMEERMKTLEEKSASKDDVDRLAQLFDAKLETVGAQIEGHRALSAATNASVMRIESIVLKKGLGGK